MAMIQRSLRLMLGMMVMVLAIGLVVLIMQLKAGSCWDPRCLFNGPDDVELELDTAGLCAALKTLTGAHCD